MAQIFASGTRNPGLLTSGTIAVPQSAAGLTYFVHSTIPQTDLDDPTVSFALDMQIMKADGTWPPGISVGITFVGGPNQGKNGGITVVPGWMQAGNDVAGKNVRFRLNVTGRSFTMGLDADPQ